jgi:hypothetical protein
VLLHAAQGLSPGHFFAEAARHWSAGGGRVLSHRGLAAPPPAHLGILHVDLTQVPRPYLELARGYARCLNAGAADIAKRVVSRQLVTPDDAYEGPVIVKSDRNFGGVPERLVKLAQAGPLERLWDRLAESLPTAWTGRLRSGRYFVLPSPRAVPGWVWRRRDLVVERFLVERQGAHYALNMWFFLGEADCIATSLATTPQVKAASTVSRLPLHDRVPESLRRRRRELGFDYGKFDYVMVEGEACLLDANRTPHCGPAGFSDRGREICRRLAAGLDALLASG